MFYINYNTGAGNKCADTLDEAMAMADDGACYTQADITIEDEDGTPILTRHWYGVEFDEDENEDKDPILFGSYGYYTDWRDE